MKKPRKRDLQPSEIGDMYKELFDGGAFFLIGVKRVEESGQYFAWKYVGDTEDPEDPELFDGPGAALENAMWDDIDDHLFEGK